MTWTWLFVVFLHQEANTLIQEANEQREHAEKMLREANYKVPIHTRNKYFTLRIIFDFLRLKQKLIIMPTLLSLVAAQIVGMTTCGTTIDNYIGIMKTLGFHCRSILLELNIWGEKETSRVE